jgi:hypothetical protein
VRGPAVGLTLVLGGMPGVLGAQAGEQAEFISAARTASERYRDRAVAVADGYRPIGPDFPSMGEHWLSVPLVVRGEIDPAHPQILEYVTVDGLPVLAGVAYTQLTRGGPLDTSLPVPASAWHYHQGSVDEESFILSHARGAAEPGPGTGPRVAVLHVWLGVENPAGLFASDNWALPWYRLGLPPPPRAERPSASDLAAALAAGGDAYFLTLLRLRYDLEPDRANRVGDLLAGHGRALRAVLQHRASARPSDTELASHWSAVEADLRTVCARCELWQGKNHP